MPIRIKTKKFLKGGQKFRRVLSVEALQLEALPEAYLKGAPFCVKWSDGVIGVWDKPLGAGGNGWCIYPGDINIYPEAEFQSMLALIKKAGVRLGAINELERRRAWRGEETIEI